MVHLESVLQRMKGEHICLRRLRVSFIRTMEKDGRTHRVVETWTGLRDRVYVAHDRFRRMLLISGAVTPLVVTINRLAISPLDKVWHQSLYACANGKIKSGVHKGQSLGRNDSCVA